MERYKLGDIDNERFYLLPKSLFLNVDYDGMSITAKVLYAVLRDRMKLSEANKWADESGEIFLLFTQEDLQKILKISHPTCVKAMKQLQKYGLIDVIRQGVQKPNKVYIRKLKNFTSQSKKNLLLEVKKKLTLMILNLVILRVMILKIYIRQVNLPTHKVNLHHQPWKK